LSIIIPEILLIDFNTDGMALHKSGNVELWPIQIRVANIYNSKPELVGIYKGPSKPFSAEEFFAAFVSELKEIQQEGGIIFYGKIRPVSLRCFIADMPARSFSLNHKGHMFLKPCSKCKVLGKMHERRVVFLGSNHLLRNDAE